MLYKISLFDGTEFDINSEEALKARERLLNGKSVVLQGALITPKAVASILPYSEDIVGAIEASFAAKREEMLQDRLSSSAGNIQLPEVS